MDSKGFPISAGRVIIVSGRTGTTKRTVLTARETRPTGRSSNKSSITGDVVLSASEPEELMKLSFALADSGRVTPATKATRQKAAVVWRIRLSMHFPL